MSRKTIITCYSTEPAALNVIKKQTFSDNISIILYSSSSVFSGSIEPRSSAEQ